MRGKCLCSAFDQNVIRNALYDSLLDLLCCQSSSDTLFLLWQNYILLIILTMGQKHHAWFLSIGFQKKHSMNSCD